MLKEASVKTVKKWEIDLNCKLDFDVHGGRIGYMVIIISWTAGYQECWISGMQNVKKDVENHMKNCDACKEAVGLQGLKSTHIGRGIKKISPHDKMSMIKFLILLSDFDDLLAIQSKNS